MTKVMFKISVYTTLAQLMIVALIDVPKGVITHWDMSHVYFWTIMAIIFGIIAIIQEEDVPKGGFWTEFAEIVPPLGSKLYKTSDDSPLMVYKVKGRKIYVVPI